MTNQLSVLPAVYKLVTDAEHRISNLVGYRVKLKMDMTGEELTETFLQVIVTSECDVTWVGMIGKCRQQNLIVARQIYSYFAYYYLKQNSIYIGRTLKKDHSTILHYLTKAKEYIQVQDGMFIRKFKAIEKKITNETTYQN